MQMKYHKIENKTVIAFQLEQRLKDEIVHAVQEQNEGLTSAKQSINGWLREAALEKLGITKPRPKPDPEINESDDYDLKTAHIC